MLCRLQPGATQTQDNYESTVKGNLGNGGDIAESLACSVPGHKQREHPCLSRRFSVFSPCRLWSYGASAAPRRLIHTALSLWSRI